MEMKKKILFVCTFNKMRSKTAEELYKNDERFSVASAGISESAAVQVHPELLAWADFVVVMEEMHRQYILTAYPDVMARKKILCLDIPDDYWFMDANLVLLINERFDERYQEENAMDSRSETGSQTG